MTCPRSFQVLSFRASWSAALLSGFGFRVSGFGFRVSGVSDVFRVPGFEFRGSDVFRVSGFGFRDSDVRFMVWGLRLMVYGLGLSGKGSGFRVWDIQSMVR